MGADITKVFILDFGCRNDGTWGPFSVYKGISDHNINFGNLGTGTDSPACHEIIFRGYKLKIVGRITIIYGIDGFVFVPENSATVPVILNWCNDNRNIVNDLFEKHGLNFVSPHTGLEFTYNKNYERYVILVDEFLRECEFVDEGTKQLMEMII